MRPPTNEAGRAVVAHLRLRVEIHSADGRTETLDFENRGVWLERTAHPSAFEAQVAEVAYKDAEWIGPPRESTA